MRIPALLCLAFLVAGCNASDENTTSSTEPDASPQMDADPTAQTGTGGESEATSPDGTVNRKPDAAAPASD